LTSSCWIVNIDDPEGGFQCIFLRGNWARSAAWICFQAPVKRNEGAVAQDTIGRFAAIVGDAVELINRFTDRGKKMRSKF